MQLPVERAYDLTAPPPSAAHRRGAVDEPLHDGEPTDRRPPQNWDTRQTVDRDDRSSAIPTAPKVTSRRTLPWHSGDAVTARRAIAFTRQKSGRMTGAGPVRLLVTG